MLYSYVAATLLLCLSHIAACGDAVRLNGRSLPTSEPIRGVNLGGWLVTEQWITPSVYQSTDAGDEWHLCNELGKDKCMSTLEKHWSSFYTLADLRAIKAAGLNAIRIPVGYWAVDIADYEPYVSGQYPYLIRGVQWAAELGLSVLIDLHGAPGSQNGQDNSGLIGPVLFPSNQTNAERSLGVLRNLTAEFEKAEYNGTVTGIELLNEPRLSDTFSMADLKDFYANGSSTVQDASGTADVNVTVHDAFYGPSYWTNYDPSNAAASQPASKLAIDTHQYYAFAPLNDLSPPEILDSICNISQLLKRPSSGIPSTIVGEWSLETTNRPTSSSHSQNGNDDQVRRTWFRTLAEAQIVAYTPNGPNQSSIGWYFWAWKTEWDIDTWSYRRGIAQGYIPSDASNSSTFAFPVLENGCVDTEFNYTAPRHPSSGAAAGAEVGGGSRLGLVLAMVFSMFILA